MMQESKREKYVLIYRWALVALGTGVIAFSVLRLSHHAFDFRWLILAFCAVVCSAVASSNIPGAKNAVTVSDTFIFLAMLLCGPDAAVIVAAIAGVGDSFRRVKYWLTLATNIAVVCCSFFIASALTHLLFGDLRLLAHHQETFFIYLLALLFLAAADGLVNAFIVLVGVTLKTGQPMLHTWRENYSWVLVTYFSGVLAATAVNALIYFYGFWAVVFILPIFVATYLAYYPYLKNIESARKHVTELKESEARFRSAFDYAAIGMALVDPDGRWLQVNHSLCKILGYAEPELLETNFQSVTYADDLSNTLVHIHQLLEGQMPAFQIEQRYVHRLGHVAWVLLSVSPTRDANSKSIRLIFQVQDITDRKRAEEQLLHDAFHDGLTGLPNRALFMDHLKLTIGRAQRRPDHTFAILFLDLDRFKIINDSLGHMLGDQLLIGIAHRLESCLRPGDTVARLGGDEFTILLEEVSGIDEAACVAERIQQELSQPFNLNGQEVFTSVSIGIAHSAISYERPEDMLRDADTAMYRAKALGTARHEIFDKAMHSHALSRLQLESDLRRAIERQEFFLQYQPIVSLKTGQLHGFEALVRWQHPERGLISPVNFIPVAEETGLIMHIGQWVLEEACRQMQEWQEQFPSDIPLQMSVNLSSKQFAQPDLIGQIEQTLRRTRLHPRCLKLEITESVVMENIEMAIGMLKQMRALGIELSIDDFGTGYSSLSYLPRFPINTLKVDRSFVTEMSLNHENAEVVRTIILLAKNLGMNVIAEGVETQDQLVQLSRLDCQYGQGYFFSKPVDGKAAVSLMQYRPWQMSIPDPLLLEQQESYEPVESALLM